jgi:ketosteroid isomerase-like protein
VSQETIERARRGFEAFNRTFNEKTRDLYEVLDPNVEWVPMSALLDGTAYHGHDGVQRWIEDMKRDWTTYEIRPERYLDLDDDRVLTLGARVGRAGTGGRRTARVDCEHEPRHGLAAALGSGPLVSGPWPLAPL